MFGDSVLWACDWTWRIIWSLADKSIGMYYLIIYLGVIFAISAAGFYLNLLFILNFFSALYFCLEWLLSLSIWQYFGSLATLLLWRILSDFKIVYLVSFLLIWLLSKSPNNFSLIWLMYQTKLLTLPQILLNKPAQKMKQIWEFWG